MSSMLGVVIFVAIMIPVFLTSMFIPYWTRKTESFGVSIPEEVYHYNELKAFRKSYAIRVGIFSMVIAAAFLLFSAGGLESEQAFSWLFSTIITTYLVGSFIIYLRYHKRMKIMKENQGWQKEKPQRTVIDTSFRDQKLTYSNAWFLLPLAVTVATVFVTFSFFDRIPERIPMQYDFEGNVTNWAEKSYRSVLFMPVMQVYLIGLFLFINSMTARAKQQVSAEKPEESKARNVIFRRRWSLFLILTSVGIVLLFSLIQWSFIFSVPQSLLVYAPILFGAAVTIASIWIAYTTGQGGSRVQMTTTDSGEVIDRDDDRYWKLGQFYFNKNDPSLFLEKRFGVGWTINLARPLVWVIFLVIIGLAVGLPLILGV